MSEIDLFGKKHSFLNVKIIVYTDWCQERNITTPLLKINSKELEKNLARFYVEARTKKGEEYSRSEFSLWVIFYLFERENKWK